jgi:hypothetical protein
MGHRRLAFHLTCSLLLVASGTGCQALHPYRPLTVLAQDAETKQPIPGAAVRISYPDAPASLAPWGSSGTTGPDGLAQVRAAPAGDAGTRLDVTAPGFLFEEQFLPDAIVRALPLPGLFAAAGPPPAPLVVELYAEPRPTIELVVPTGYRGVVKAELEVSQDVPCPPGQRCFPFEVSPAGDVRVTGPVLLRRALGPNYRARYADGTLLGRDGENQEVGFRWLKCEGNTQYFVVGTQSEFNAYRRDSAREGEDRRPSQGGKGEGRGRHGRRGDPSSAAADSGTTNTPDR